MVHALDRRAQPAGRLRAARHVDSDDFNLAAVRRPRGGAGATTCGTGTGERGLHDGRGLLAYVLDHHAAQHPMGIALRRIAYLRPRRGRVRRGAGGRRRSDAVHRDRNEVGAYAMVLALAVISFCLLWLMEYARKHTQDE